MSDLPKDLFESRQDWLLRPKEAYRAWISHQKKYSDSSRRIYISMWNRFCTWLEQELVRVDRCEPYHFEKFINQGQFTPLYQRRYAQVCESVWKHLGNIGIPVQNPAWRYMDKGKKEGEGNKTHLLEDHQISSLEAILITIFEKPVLVQEGNFWEWVSVRDAVITSLMIGAGVGISEVVGLPVNGAIYDGKRFVVPARGDQWERRAIVYPAAVRGLEVWGAWRVAAGLKGPFLFPANLKMRRERPSAAGLVMPPTAAAKADTVAEGIQALMAAAGIEGKGVGPQSLRNTYAGRLFADGHDDITVAESMGLRMPASASRLRGAWMKKQEAVVRHP